MTCKSYIQKSTTVPMVYHWSL